MVAVLKPGCALSRGFYPIRSTFKWRAFLLASPSRPLRGRCGYLVAWGQPCLGPRRPLCHCVRPPRRGKRGAGRTTHQFLPGLPASPASLAPLRLGRAGYHAASAAPLPPGQVHGSKRPHGVCARRPNFSTSTAPQAPPKGALVRLPDQQPSVSFVSPHTTAHRPPNSVPHFWLHIPRRKVSSKPPHSVAEAPASPEAESALRRSFASVAGPPSRLE